MDVPFAWTKLVAEARRYKDALIAPERLELTRQIQVRWQEDLRDLSRGDIIRVGDEVFEFRMLLDETVSAEEGLTAMVLVADLPVTTPEGASISD